MRPATLAEVAELIHAGDSFDLCLANFLDGFYASPTVAAIAPMPRLLGPAHGEMGQIQDAYLAATAEHLAQRFALRLPDWVYNEARMLHRPWFATTLASMRAILIHESPAAFRSRNLFISENALTRA